MGGALPFWFAAIMFALSTTGLCSSGGDYIGKSFDFALSYQVRITKEVQNEDGTTTQESTLETRSRTIFSYFYDKINPNNEYAPNSDDPEAYKASTLKTKTKKFFKKMFSSGEGLGTLIGISVGIGIGIALIAAGLSTLPMFGAGLPLVFTGILTIIIYAGAMGGLGNRIGYAVDHLLLRHRESIDEPAPLPIGEDDDLNIETDSYTASFPGGTVYDPPPIPKSASTPALSSLVEEISPVTPPKLLPLGKDDEISGSSSDESLTPSLQTQQEELPQQLLPASSAANLAFFPQKQGELKKVSSLPNLSSFFKPSSVATNHLPSSSNAPQASITAVNG
jgi:hypothetical protein